VAFAAAANASAAAAAAETRAGARNYRTLAKKLREEATSPQSCGAPLSLASSAPSTASKPSFLASNSNLKAAKPYNRTVSPLATRSSKIKNAVQVFSGAFERA